MRKLTRPYFLMQYGKSTSFCCRKNPHKVLVTFQLKIRGLICEHFQVWGSDPVTIFRPIIEGEDVNDAALPKELRPEHYQSQSLPVIIGTNTGEGAFRVLGWCI